jgi:hypothetical protein
MNLKQFRESLAENAPPAETPDLLTALWWEGKGDWQRAHELAQQGDTPEHAWVHAYLHRKEGDAANARYWYDRAARPVASGDSQEEWTQITQALLTQAAS